MSSAGGAAAAASITARCTASDEGREFRRLPQGAQWALIAGVIGPRLVNDVRVAIERGPPAYGPGDLDRGARVFFGWLRSASADPGWRPVLDAYSGATATGGSVTDDTAVFAADACFRKFGDELPVFASIAGTTAWIRQRCAAIVLERLGQAGGSRYPAFAIAPHKRHQALGETPMLGSLPISVGIDAPPGVLREVQALERVGLLALEEFRDHVALIDSATPIRAAPLSLQGASPARASVHGALAQAWSLLSIPWVGIVRQASHFVSDATDMIMDPGTWIAAGIPDRCVSRFSPNGAMMSRTTVGRLALACLGPSPTMVLAGAAVVACGRGWNKTSIRAIPAAPFAFASQGKYGIAGGSFVTAFKARAGHAVAMFLSDPPSAGDAVAEELAEIWRATATAPGADLLGDQMLLGFDPDDAPGAAVLEVFDALMRVSKPLRAHDKVFGSTDRLFAFPLLNERDEKGVQGTLRLTELTTPAFVMGGANFRSIRASYIYVENTRGRSLTTTMAASGQVAPTVTMRNYLNRREVGVELRKALRFFQSICEALVLGDDIASLKIGMVYPDLERLRRLARASGMAAAFGLDVPQVVPEPVLRFTPSDANLRDLFLTLWALRVAARVLPSATWRARCLEPFAAARAIAAKLREAGLATDYAIAARAAYADHRAGRVSLPHLEGT